MRFVLTLDQAVASAGVAFCVAVGWTLGCWLAGRLLALIK